MEGPELEISDLHELERVVGDETAKPKRLALSLLQRITDHFDNDRMLGRGGSGEVYKGRLPNELDVAVKRVYRTEGCGSDEFENQVLTLMKVCHKNVVRFIGYCSHTKNEFMEFNGRYVLAYVSEMLICMEYMPNGSLNKFLSDSSSGLDWNYRYKILGGICNALRHLHDEVRIMHGDIKPDNILLDSNLEPKISDFGLSRSFVEGESLDCSENMMGTRGYIAPEIIDEGRCSIKSDIFSLGVTIMNLLLGYEWNWVDQSLEQALENWRKRLEATYQEVSLCENKYQQVRTCLEIGYNCVDRDPDKRPTAMEIIHRLEETASTDYSGSSGHAPTLWQEHLSGGASLLKEPGQAPLALTLAGLCPDKHGQGSREIDWDMRYKLIKGTCKGLRYLHKDRGNGPIVHLNLCPSNVLLDEKHAACVTGFDFTKLIGEKENRSIAVKKDGQISYLPPDFFHCRGTDLKYLATVDIYSLGLMILEIATRQEIKGKHEMLIKRIEENWREESQIESLYPSLEPEKPCQVKLCIDIGLDCVKSKPENRSTAGDIVTWLEKGTKLVPGPRARAGVPIPPVRTNITQADDHIQEKEKWSLKKLFGLK